jgi:hypothetical protein
MKIKNRKYEKEAERKRPLPSSYIFIISIFVIIPNLG